MLRDATVRRFGTFRWRYHHRKILQRHLSQPKSMARKSIRNGRKLFFYIFHQKNNSGPELPFLEFYFSDVCRHSDHHQREARGSPPRPRGIAIATIKSSTSHAQMHWLKYQSSRLELGNNGIAQNTAIPAYSYPILYPSFLPFLSLHFPLVVLVLVIPYRRVSPPPTLGPVS